MDFIIKTTSSPFALQLDFFQCRGLYFLGPSIVVPAESEGAMFLRKIHTTRVHVKE